MAYTVHCNSGGASEGSVTAEKMSQVKFYPRVFIFICKQHRKLAPASFLGGGILSILRYQKLFTLLLYSVTRFDLATIDNGGGIKTKVGGA